MLIGDRFWDGEYVPLGFLVAEASAGNGFPVQGPPALVEQGHAAAPQTIRGRFGLSSPTSPTRTSSSCEGSKTFYLTCNRTIPVRPD